MEKEIHPTLKLDETEGFECHGHSIWTICIPLSHFFPKIFPTFFTFILGGQFLLPQRPNNWKRKFTQLKKLDESEGFECHGHSIWTICIPLSHFCPKNFLNFSLLYWEANSNYPRGPIIGKGKREMGHLPPFKPLLWACVGSHALSNYARRRCPLSPLS